MCFIKTKINRLYIENEFNPTIDIQFLQFFVINLYCFSYNYMFSFAVANLCAFYEKKVHKAEKMIFNCFKQQKILIFSFL